MAPDAQPDALTCRNEFTVADVIPSGGAGRAPQGGEPGSPAWGAGVHPRGEPGAGRGARPAPLRAPRGDLGARTTDAGFSHPSHPSSLQKHTFAHLCGPVAGVRELNKSGTVDDTALFFFFFSFSFFSG